MTAEARSGALTEVPEGPGLRSRLILGVVSVSVITAVITAGTAVVAALVIFGTRPVTAQALGRRLAGQIRLLGMSDNDAILLVIGAALGVLAISVGSGWLMAQRMLRPVRRLAEAADRVAAGDLDIRLPALGTDELAQLAITFNSMTANLARSMEDLRRLEAQSRRFAADVSHELRTPLAAMTAVTDVLSDETGGMSPNAARAARLMVREISHLDRLVIDLIEMSRFDAGTAVLDTDVIAVAPAVHACLARRGWAGQVAVNIPGSLVAVLDRRRFDVIVANLVGNSVKYGAAPIEISAVAARSGSRLVLTVTDCGPGLPVAALPHVFERFYKADGARARSDGSGLGLAISAENARLHGGTLTAENRPEGGAVFRLDLPTSTDPTSTSAERTA